MATRHMEKEKPIIIAGPCAAESPEQMRQTAEEARKRSIDTVRLSLWKPRTKPGFDGIKEKGIPVLLEVTQMGLRPATEVMLPQHAQQVMEGVLGQDTHTSILLWIGSRNSNHMIQNDIGRAIAGEPRVMLMIKNQMWKDASHWRGIVDHVLAGGAAPEQLILCHRGFAPANDTYRNPPDFNLALQLKEDMQNTFGVAIPMIADPSHIAGISPENVISVARNVLSHEIIGDGRPIRFDGIILEVHPDPQRALTDPQQQLSWDQLDSILPALRNRDSSGDKTSTGNNH